MLRKIWHSESRFMAVFVKDDFPKRIFSGQTIAIVLDHDRAANQCVIDAAAGAAAQLRGTPENLESAFRKYIEEVARENGWHYEPVPVKPTYKGIKCPSCGAYYQYSPGKRLDDGRVACQNCGKPFFPGQEQDS